MKIKIQSILYAAFALFMLTSYSNLSYAKKKGAEHTQSEPLDSAAVEAEYQKGKELYDQKKYKEAFDHLLRAAQAGHPEAQMRLGKMYYNGWGVKHSHDTARQWHEKAAAQGNEESKRKLEKMDAH